MAPLADFRPISIGSVISVNGIPFHSNILRIVGESLDTNTASTDKTREPETPKKKKPYNKPSFRVQTVVEVSALSCGKLYKTKTASS